MLTAWRRVKPNCLLVIALNVESAERHAFAASETSGSVKRDGRTQSPIFHKLSLLIKIRQTIIILTSTVTNYIVRILGGSTRIHLVVVTVTCC